MQPASNTENLTRPFTAIESGNALLDFLSPGSFDLGKRRMQRLDQRLRKPSTILRAQCTSLSLYFLERTRHEAPPP